MANEKTVELGEARPYALVIEGGPALRGMDRRPLAVIVEALKHARKTCSDKVALVTWTDALLEGDEDGFGVVHYFEPLKVVGIKCGAEDADEDDEDDFEEVELPLKATDDEAATDEEEEPEVKPLFKRLPPQPAPPTS